MTASRPLRGQPRSRLRPAALGGALLLLAGGCGAFGSRGGTGPGSTGLPSTPGGALIADLVSNDNGLAVRQWSVLDRPETIASVLAAHEARELLDPSTRQRLRRNGIRVVCVQADALDSIATELGGTTMNLNAWYGQVFDWRELVSRPVPASGQAIALDGRARRYAGGDFRLMCRGWTVQMETGPSFTLEIIPQYQESDGGFVRLLGGPAAAAEPFPSLGVDFVLEAGLAYVITCESPAVNWGEPIVEEDDPAAVEGRAPRETTGPGPGPAAAGPPTLGEWLLSSARPPRSRAMLVLVPRIPPELWPDPIAPPSVGVAENANR